MITLYARVNRITSADHQTVDQSVYLAPNVLLIEHASTSGVGIHALELVVLELGVKRSTTILSAHVQRGLLVILLYAV